MTQINSGARLFEIDHEIVEEKTKEIDHNVYEKIKELRQNDKKISKKTKIIYFE